MPIMAARLLRSSFSLVHMPASSALVLERKGTTEAAGEESDGEENPRGGLAKLLVDGLAGGDLGAGGGDETEHGEAAVHDLRTGAREVGALGAGEGEGLREGEGGGNRGAAGPRGRARPRAPRRP